MFALKVEDIARNFDEQDRVRGRAYQHQGRVHDLKIGKNGSPISALVHGSTGTSYNVQVNIENNKGPLVFHSECSCPVVYSCKHAAAAVFETIAQTDRKRERLPTSRPYEDRRQAVSTPSGQAAVKAPTETEPPATQRLIYIVRMASEGKRARLSVSPYIETLLKNGGWSKPRNHSFQEILIQNQYTHLLSKEDHGVFHLINPTASMVHSQQGSWYAPEDPDTIDIFLNQVISTGRAFYNHNDVPALKLGPDIKAKLAWSIRSDGKQEPTLNPEKSGLIILLSNSPWYVDPVTQIAGSLRFSQSFDEVQNFLALPALTERGAETFLSKRDEDDRSIPAPYLIKPDAKNRSIKPIPKLHIIRDADGKTNIAQLMMNYDGVAVDPSVISAYFYQRADDEAVRYKRDKKAESSITKQLVDADLQPLHDATPLLPPGHVKEGIYYIAPANAPDWFWLDFMQEKATALREDDFIIDIEANAGVDVLNTDDDDVEASFTQNGEWWFSLDLGITVNGERVALLPILVSLLKNIHSPADIDHLTSGKKCYAPLPDGRRIALPSERVRTILMTLVELFGDKPLDEKNQLRVSFDLASALLKIKDFTRKRWMGEGQLKNLVQRLADFEGIEDKPLPQGFLAELRPYQKQGYDWLHFLGTYNLGGILADDMGLGKTVQALAYILDLKKQDKLGTGLVIMPTSLVTNWQSEAAKFAPELKILTLHGKDRAEKLDEIKDADVVLTTYPLVIRDIEDLHLVKWGLVILDEAQAIKNPTSKIMQAVCRLDAKQRLCLTGTPVENHLGELWSLFAFLMPGLLGDYKGFTKLYRTPIEKNNDAERHQLLSRRLKPFILRRLKVDVTKELPPKTEIIQRVELGDDQRDLYETVRHVMDQKVLEQITEKGFARSQIVILDALLKLRQVCCDPRLVKIAAAHKAQSSAKLAALMEMLPTLIEDGRRILLFSQFTSMLDLIKPELDLASIPYVELRGTTKDRHTPITRFQNEEVPLFLISLKAGGTGLNLTSADTVIHFDPWWNPSVENQATDRAHRIGQSKPVFVYKLIAAGTVEERILDLQAKKAHLAGALFGESPAAAAALTPDDLKWLMESV